jgi:glyoxylase-like metal-dependent hydrolase (beta-lactamase superfamily II)
MSNVIYPLLLGKQTFSKGQFTYFMNYDQKIWVPNAAWLIRTEEKDILVDTGISGQDVKRYLFGNLYEDYRSIEEALVMRGSDLSRIKIIIQTHLHYDHCGNNKLFPEAKVIIQAKELAFARNPHPVFRGSYNPSFFESSDFEIIEGEKEIVPGVSVIPVPGHTPGVQAVLVDLEDKKAALTGFCCVLENFEPPEKIRKHWPVIPIGVSANSLEAYDSMLKLKGMVDLIIPMHSMEYAKKEFIY